MAGAFIHGSIVLILSILTQIGGVAYLVALLLTRWIRPLWLPRLLGVVLIFFATYGALSVMAYMIAPVFGRTALPCGISAETNLRLQSPLYCVLNRHYVEPRMKEVATRLASHMAERYPGTVTLALDGNFPFIDGFPLLPHLSHDDGRKLDFAFYYQTAEGAYAPAATKSPIGYWAFEKPGPEGQDACVGRNDVVTMRWDMIWFQATHNGHRIDEERTGEALKWLVRSGPDLGVEKIFIEPHLAERLDVKGDIVRFQGCRAARHDDHIHVQIGA